MGSRVGKIRRMNIPAGSVRAAVGFCRTLKFGVTFRAIGRTTGRGITFLGLKGLIVRACRGGTTGVRSNTVSRITVSIGSIRGIRRLIATTKLGAAGSRIRFLPF